MEGMSIGEICQAVEGDLALEVDRSRANFEPPAASIDSRTIRPGEVFFALPGRRTDGHKFVQGALKRGASAVVVARRWYSSHPDPKAVGGALIVVEDPLIALAQLARYYRAKFSISVVAITGSNGKTTTKDMTAQVLSTSFRVLKTEGNFNTRIGVPLTLLRFSSRHQIAVLELGASAPGQIRSLCELTDPCVGLITNVGPAHLEFFGSLEKVAATKGELLEYMDESSTAILNFDDKALTKEKDKTRGRLLGFSLEEMSHFRGEELVFDQKGCGRFSLRGVEIGLALPGRHNVYNALAAAAVASHFGISTSRIKEALEDFRPPSMRMELLERDGTFIINDTYNANPVSAKAALDVLASFSIEAGGRRIAVLGDMLELGQSTETAHEEIGRYAASLRIDCLLTVGPYSKTTVRGVVEGGMRETQARHFRDNNEVFLFLDGFLKSRDVVLIKGSRGMRMEEIVEKLGGRMIRWSESKRPI